jgi:hypothetical protein
MVPSVAGGDGRQYPFSELRGLSDAIEDRFQQPVARLQDPQSRPWLTALGRGLRRVILENDDETERVRALAERLAPSAPEAAARVAES